MRLKTCKIKVKLTRINKLRTKVNTKRNEKLKKIFRKRTAPNATLRKLKRGVSFYRNCGAASVGSVDNVNRPP